MVQHTSPAPAETAPGPGRPVRVAVLNDHELVVEGVAAMLRRFPDRVRLEDVTTQAAPGDEVDVVLYDMFGTAAEGRHWSELVGQGWSPRYVVQYDWKSRTHTDEDEQQDGPVVLQVPKWLDGEGLVAAIEEIWHTGGYAGPMPPATPPLADDPAQDDPAADPGRATTERQWPGKGKGLTERESEVVALIVEGLSNQQIAETLFLGINTIKTYVRTAYRTMGVTDRSNAVLWGIDHGFRLQRPPR